MSNYIEAKYRARVDVVPSDPSAFCLSVTDESGTYANAFLTHEQAAQVAAALTGQEPEWKPGDMVLDAEDRAWGMDEDGDWNRVGSRILYHGIEALAESFGPLRRAKVVEADQ